MHRVVDLTQPLGAGTAVWPGAPAVSAEVLGRIEADGAYYRAFTTPEHAGTHLDAPAHFVEGALTVDRIPAERLVAECALLDVSDRCAGDPEFTLEAELVEELEARDGRIEPGQAVLVATGWERHVGDPARVLGGGSADDLHFPGIGASAAELLVERGAVGIGIDTVSVDAGHATDFPVHKRTLPAGLWHLEGLVNLGQLPVRGALLMVGALPLRDGSGAPARVLALVR